MPTRTPPQLSDAPADAVTTSQEFSGNWGSNEPFSLSARDQPVLQQWHVFPCSQKDLNTGEELTSLPDLPKISQFSMLLREGTGKQNDDTLTFVKLEKTG